jgi:hypothetical protein
MPYWGVPREGNQSLPLVAETMADVLTAVARPAVARPAVARHWGEQFSEISPVA